MLCCVHHRVFMCSLILMCGLVFLQVKTIDRVAERVTEKRMGAHEVAEFLQNKVQQASVKWYSLISLTLGEN